VFRTLVVLLVGFVMLTSGASAGTFFFYGESLPTLKDFKARFQFQNTLIEDRFGNHLYDMADLSNKNRGRRIVEPLIWPGHTTQYYRSQHEGWLVGPRSAVDDGHGIPVVFQDATIATEDSTFYSNPGFDPLSIGRAAYDNLVTGHVVSGASTITQQLVREYMLQPAPTLTRKSEEIILAAELTQKYPKSKILWYYLNSVPYGNLSTGAEAAAQSYFHTDIWNLDLAQSAMLAGLPEAPSTYNPVNNLPTALARMHYVLHLMYTHGYLVDAQGHPDKALITQAMNEARTWKFTPAVTLKKYPHFVQYAIDQLQHIPQLQGRIYNGLIVKTTLDPRLQNAAQQIVSQKISQLSGQNVTDGALVTMSVDPRCYGCILAMVGSANYNNKAISGQINMADTPRQPGSSFKPFNYIYGFMHGLGPATTVLDGPLALPDPGNSNGGWYEPLDYDHSWHGVVTLRTALDNSLNIPALRVEQYNTSIAPNGEGLKAIENQAVIMGMKSLPADNPNCCGWSLTLGGLEHGVRLVEETSAYGTFAARGKTVPPTAIMQVYDRTTGKLLWDWDSWLNSKDNSDRPQQAIDPAYADVMTNVLSDNSSRCTPQVCEFGLDSPLNLGRPVAAKTGTTEVFTDNWTVGYTPDIVTGVWVGNANYSPMIDSTGITGAAPIWHDFMLRAFDILNLPPKNFVESPAVYSGSECREPGQYTTYGIGAYDIYAGQIPLCTVGSSDTTLPVPQTNSANNVSSAPAPPPAASNPAPVPPPTAAPPAPAAPAQQVPGVQPANPAAPSAPVQQAPPAAQQPVQQQPAAQSPPAQQPPAQQPAAQPPAAQQPAQSPSSGQPSSQVPGVQPSP
jgi:membrane peptidoglycan carboxypeptidase